LHGSVSAAQRRALSIRLQTYAGDDLSRWRSSDILSLMDQPAFTGCVVQPRLLGVLETAQTSDGKTERNDRLSAVAAESHTHSSLKSLGMLDLELIQEIEHFVISYNQIRGNMFKPIERKGPHVATRLVKKHQKGKKKR